MENLRTENNAINSETEAKGEIFFAQQMQFNSLAKSGTCSAKPVSGV